MKIHKTLKQIQPQKAVAIARKTGKQIGARVYAVKEVSKDGMKRYTQQFESLLDLAMGLA